MYVHVYCGKYGYKYDESMCDTDDVFQLISLFSVSISSTKITPIYSLRYSYSHGRFNQNQKFVDFLE